MTKYISPLAFRDVLGPSYASILIPVLLTLLSQPWSSGAEGYSIDWSTVDGGWGTSTGGVYSVSGTVGQSDAGKMSGGSFTLDGGFWGIIAAVQTPGAPLLSITLNSQPSTISVSWAVSATSWQLQATTNLVTGSSAWSSCSYVTNGASCVYVEPAPVGNRFYRLREP